MLWWKRMQLARGTGEREFQPEEVAYAEAGRQKESKRQRQRGRENMNNSF